MTAKYHPLASDYQTVVNWLTGQGLKIPHQDPNHIAIFATGTVNQIQRVLQVSFARVTSKNVESSRTESQAPYGNVLCIAFTVDSEMPQCRNCGMYDNSEFRV